MLATNLVQASVRIEDFAILVHSPPGVGKSCFGASLHAWLESQKMPPAYYLDLDMQEGLAAHTLYRSSPRSWSDLDSLVKDLELSEDFSWVVVDLLDGLCDLSFEDVCKRNNVKHPTEKGEYMKMMWNVISTQSVNIIRRLMRSGKGVLATTHSELTAVNFQGRKYNRWVPNLGIPSTYRMLEGAFPIIGFMNLESIFTTPTNPQYDPRMDVSDLEEAGETRMVYFTPSKYWVAKDHSRRLGEKPIKLSLDYRDDWAAFMRRWEGQEEGEETLVGRQAQDSTPPVPSLAPPPSGPPKIVNGKRD